MKDKVFVYGTLKKGGHNHRVMEQAGGAFIKHHTITGYKKIQPKELSFPYVIKTGDENDYVEGEVYEVDNIKPIDWLEGYPSLYGKEEIEPRTFIYVAGPSLLAREPWFTK